MIWFEIASKRILILRMYRLAFYGEDWRYMGRKSEMPVIESVEFNYIGTDNMLANRGGVRDNTIFIPYTAVGADPGRCCNVTGSI